MARRIVTFAPYVPYRGIGHGGGAVLQAYVEHTRRLGDRILVAPRSEVNLEAAVRHTGHAHLIRERRSPPFRATNLVVRQFVPDAPAVYFASKLVRDHAVRTALVNADIVEYHWHSMAMLLAWGRRHAPQARHIVFLHDVVSQRLEREAAAHLGPLRASLLLQARFAKRYENRIVRDADAILVLSRKDADLLPPSRKVFVARPPVQPESASVVQRDPSTRPLRMGARARFIFVGAFYRRENVEAAKWLAGVVWPLIVAEMPTAELRFVGEDRAGKLASIVGTTKGAVHAGYVVNLASEYEIANVALVPLLSGAGVKIKTLEALVAGTPVVSTPIGVEGIDRGAELVTVAADPEAFATAALDVARDQDGRYARLASEARQWATSAYGHEQFRAAIEQALGREADCA